MCDEPWPSPNQWFLISSIQCKIQIHSNSNIIYWKKQNFQTIIFKNYLYFIFERKKGMKESRNKMNKIIIRNKRFQIQKNECFYYGKQASKQ